MSEGRGRIRHDCNQWCELAAPFPRAPIPRSESGSFYFAEKRNFLLCVDMEQRMQRMHVGRNVGQPCETVYTDHWGLPLWNVCDAHVEHAEKNLPAKEMPAGFFPSESLALEWLSYIKQQNHPKNSFPRPNDPSFGEPK
jgi:hypothetical protein